MYLSDSGSVGQAIEEDFTQRAQTLSAEERPWLVASYKAGDVVFHDPYIVHASSKNEDSRRIQVSTDLRFYEGSSADDRWMKLWTPGDRL
ncbi:phytanoyl-CoA dioxygenase [Penicillium alfredii]|uniref:Phytanoyl-CoA dioxygenase n=1 Tax=Penicillium alfredii TaxID=1506179 RepID=A0A9W9K4G5_9EURO|nr:phytanoyl-CoA dioxygenase [Penicillium alfredii]KAJ5092475.1 phytanoyl-CoA dioxygenase [Penicillium alfredii]